MTQLQATPTDSSMAAVIQRLQGYLVPGETVQSVAVQDRFYAALRLQRRGFIAATSGRLIFIQRSLFGSFSMRDFQWQDVRDARINETFFGAEITCTTHQGSWALIAGLEKTEAQRVYVYCQSQEQIWREKNRVRQMEERRVSAPALGGVGYPSATTSPADTIARLQQAKAMLDQGLISDTEYESIKAKAIAGM